MRDLKEQTAIIIEHLLDQDPWGLLETDCDCDSDSSGPISEDEAILKVAQCLRKLGDEYNDNLQREMKTFHPRLQEPTSEVFSKMVTELSNNHVLLTNAQQLGPEMNMLRTTVILGMYIAKELPELLPSVKTAMVNYINTNLLTWIRHSGGWENLL
ncbi:bcl-2-like protein 15 isoform X2 [Rhinoraja longicauda]